MNNSALRTVEILELLAVEPMTLSSLCNRLQLPKSSAHDILSALASKGFVQCDSMKCYRLGLSAYRVGMAYISGADLYTAAHEPLQQLSRALEQTVYLAVEDGGFVVYLDKAEQSSPIRFTRNVGDRNYLTCTGLGKAIMAARPELLDRLPYPLKQKTATTLYTREALLGDLEATRSRGYALDMGEDNELLRCVAVPVRDYSGNAIGAISCSMLTPAFEKADVSQIAAKLTETALVISHSLGYTGMTLY